MKRQALFVLLISVFLLVMVSTATGETIFVDDDATNNGGSSWQNAFNYLQDALAVAQSGDQIWVAHGTYTPDTDTAHPNGTGNREATFRLKNGVAVRGGYAGYSEPDPNMRDIELYETILSGDLAGNDIQVDPCDLLTEPTRAENSYRVVTGGGTDMTAVLAGFTIIGGNANGSNSNYRGGGMYNYSGSPVVTNCRFTGNSVRRYGGGMWNYKSSPTLKNCIFSGNFAREGGGLYNRDRGCHPVLTNCIFSGNSAGEEGGGVYNFWCSPTLTNCTFSNNSAGKEGGGMYNYSHVSFPSNPILTNCIFWGNSDRGGLDESAQIHRMDSSVPVINYSCIQGLSGSLGGTGNIGNDPLFVNADGEDNVAGTGDDNLRLLLGSPCVDAGDNTAVPPSVLTDLNGHPRFIDDPDTGDTGNGTPPIVDMGAYEGTNQGFLISPKLVFVPEGETAMFTVALVMDPLEAIEVSVAHQSGDPDITVESGASLTFDSTNYSDPQTVTLAAAEDGDKISGVAQVWVSAPGFFTAVVNTTEVEFLFVDTDATGNDDGSSWDNAYNYLQDALAVAPIAVEIRVAEGIYKPDQNFTYPDGSGSKNSTFRLKNGVVIKGGYAGFAEPDPNARDINAYETILSGDIGTVGNKWDNSYHVVTGSGTNEMAILDGFTITGGNGYAYENGGGMYNKSGSPTVINCTFSRNQARYGGGMSNLYWSSPTLTNCVFRDNTVWFDYHAAKRYGGGMYNHSSSPVLTNCIFIENSADRPGYAGGMYNSASNPILANCAFIGNFSVNGKSYGGGMINDSSSSPTLTNCILWANSGRYGTVESKQIRGGTPVVNYCCIQGWTGLLGGIGNIGDDPFFMNPDKDDYYLLPYSPCIDTGDPNYIAKPNETDLAGRPRIIGGRIDMGAYEANYIEVVMKFTPQTLNPASQGKWVKAHFVLPEGFVIEDVDANTPATIVPLGIKSDHINVFINEDGLVKIEAAFSRADFCGLVITDDTTEVMAMGLLTTGQHFYGTDTIRIISKKLEQLAVLSSYWLQEGCGQPDWCSEADLNYDSVVNFMDFALLDGCCIEIIEQ